MMFYVFIYAMSHNLNLDSWVHMETVAISWVYEAMCRHPSICWARKRNKKSLRTHTQLGWN